MNALRDRRVLMAAGAGAALLAGALIATVFTGRGKAPPPPAAEDRGRLQVQLGEQPKLDPSRELRCFVNGQFVGTATLADCAKRNGVAAQALDVGLDQSGALAAGGQALQPLPRVLPQVAAVAPPPVLDHPAPSLTQAAVNATGECLRYGAEGWRPTGGAVTLSACVQALFAGRCQQPGQALYGRWASQSLRLVPGRVETSPDNRDFRPLVEQGRDCSIPPL